MKGLQYLKGKDKENPRNNYVSGISLIKKRVIPNNIYYFFLKIRIKL